MKTPKFLDESVCIGCKQVLGVSLSCVRLFLLLLINFCVKEMVRFQRSCYQIFFQKPYSYFGYRLSYNHQNGVILIGKEP